MSLASQGFVRRLTTIAVCAAASCAVSDRSHLYGDYVADYRVALEKLALSPDGTFIQRVTIKSTSATVVSTGGWTYDARSGYVTFDERLVHVVDGFGNFDPEYERRPRGLTVYPAEKYCGVVSIGSDEGIRYRKE